jgi:hypothetical protein
VNAPGLHNENAGINAAEGVRHDVEDANGRSEHGKSKHEPQQIEPDADEVESEGERKGCVVTAVASLSIIGR